MPDPMHALESMQDELQSGLPFQKCVFSKEYKVLMDEPHGKQRFSYAKIILGKVVALSLFAIAEPIDSVLCFNIGYAVCTANRGQGLGIESVQVGIEEMKNGLRRFGHKKFYLEAVVENSNIASVKVAEDIFSNSGVSIKDSFSGKPALYFRKMISL